jgi:two-component sensor histidine kinase
MCPDRLANRIFLGHGGELGRLIREFDWSRTPLGPPEKWPQSLKTAVRLMLTSRHPMFIWWGPELIQLYNDAYRETMGPERHPSALGQPGRECWAEIWPIIGPQIELVMRGQGSTWHEEQLVPVTRHGALREVWWTYGYSPIDIEGGGVGGVLVVCNDVTEQHLARQALAQANEKLLGDVDRLRDLFGQAPGFMAVLKGPAHVFEFTNAAYDRLIGRDDLVGKRVAQALPEVETQGFVTLLDDVYRSGAAHVGTGVPLVLARSTDAPARQVYLDFVYQPVRDASGAVTGIFVEGYEVTARIVAEQRQKLLVEEMRHRVKNILATVQSLAMLSGKTAASIEEYKSIFSQRIVAMARTQDLATHGHAGAVSVREVIEAELAPYLGRQIELSCAEIAIDAGSATSLGLLIHELLTNAAKYGALASPDGVLKLDCRAEGDQALLRWRETMPNLEARALKQGFGARLIERLAADLGGTAALALLPGGLEAEIRFQLTTPAPKS